MANINIYPVKPIPEIGDLVIGSDMATQDKETKNFELSTIVDNIAHTHIATQINYDNTISDTRIQLNADNVQLALDEINLNSTLKNSRTTGILEGGKLSIITTTTFSIDDGEGIIVQPSLIYNPSYIHVNWTGLQNITIDNPTQNGTIFLYIDSTGTLLQQTITTRNDIIDKLYIGYMLKYNSVIEYYVSQPLMSNYTAISNIDLLRILNGNIVNGLSIFGNTDLTFGHNAGEYFEAFSNYNSDVKNPHIFHTDYDPIIAYKYIDMNGKIYSPDQTILDVTNYETAPGVITPIPPFGNNLDVASIQRLFIIPGPGGEAIIMRGQNIYLDVNDALSNLTNDEINHVYPDIVKNYSIFLGYLITGRLDTNLSLDSIILNANTFGGISGGGGGGAGSAEQIFYDNSTSGLASSNVQDAIDENANDIQGKPTISIEDELTDNMKLAYVAVLPAVPDSNTIYFTP